MESIMLDYFDGEFICKLVFMCQLIEYIADKEQSMFWTIDPIDLVFFTQDNDKRGAFSIVQTVW